MSFCPKCGAKVPGPESKFCANCGEKLPGLAASAGETTAEWSGAENELPKRPQAAPAPTDSTASPSLFGGPPASSSKDAAAAPPSFEGASDLSKNSGMTSSFSSPFVKDTSRQPRAAAPKEEPLFSPAFSQDSPQDAPAKEDLFGAPSQKPASLFEEEPVVPVQKIDGNMSDLESLLDEQESDVDAPEDGKEPDTDFFKEETAEAENTEDKDEFGLFEEKEEEPEDAPIGDTQDLFKDAQPLEELDSEPESSDDFLSVDQQEPPAPAPAPRQQYPRQRDDMVQNISQAAQKAEDQPVQRMPQQQYPTSQQYPTGHAAQGGSTLPEASSAARRPTPERRTSAPSRARGRRGGGNFLRNLLIGVLVGLLLLFGVILGVLYWQHRPSKTIDAFTEALASRDYQTLSDTVSVVGVTSSGSEGWIALCDAFQEQSARDELSKEMARVSADPTKTDFEYPSVRLEGETVFLFVKQYHVRVSAVTLLAPDAPDGTMVRLAAGDEFSDHTGTADENGVLYEGVMPGQYTATVNPPDGSSAEYLISVFLISEPNRIENMDDTDADESEEASTVANLTIQNCISDDATITLDDRETPQKPSGGVLQLQQIELGTVIGISAVVDGQTQQSSVTFSDPNQTTLRFENYTQSAGPTTEASALASQMTADDINAVLVPFYQSYLDAINAQSLDGIRNSTASNTASLESRITSPANQANTYTYVNAACDAASIQAEDSGGTATLTFTANCSFQYAPKDDAANVQEGSNNYTVRMVYSGGQWLVDSFSA